MHNPVFHRTKSSENGGVLHMHNSVFHKAKSSEYGGYYTYTILCLPKTFSSISGFISLLQIITDLP